MSDFNKILAFQNMMPYLSEDEQNKLAQTLGMKIEEIIKRLVGKNKEDEFILILLFMNICKSITAFDEGISQLLKTATSDLLVELNNGEKFMLEIKHTDKVKYSISGGNLKRRIDYAHKFNLKLYFAISIKGCWMLFDEDYLQQKNGKIDISDLTKSKLDEKLNCLSYIFPKTLRIKSVYSKDEKKSIGIEFESYGYLVSYELYYGDKKIFRIKGKNSPIIGYTMILEALQDRLSMDTQTIEQSGNYTIINESFTRSFNSIPEYKFLLAPIEHMVNDENEKYTAHKYIETTKLNPNLLENRIKLEHIRGVMQFLVDNGVDIKYTKGTYVYQLPLSK
ncbi:hypothetical protein [uncultured Clostridium sp.]|uniref:hypothetical protein n=1 Tax=uncultured Clostridium sp. TaxID=59620 RepID=UPI0025CF58DA|nr:hypothetical protein [uncultured Clostridium sp.]